MTSLSVGRVTSDRPPESRVRTVLMTADAIGGVWSYSVDLARALAARGVTCTLAVMGPAPSPARREEAARAGVQIVHAPYRLEWMPEAWQDFDAAAAWLRGLDARLQPDLIHLNGYTHAALPWSAPVIVVAHSCVCSWWRAVKGESGGLDLQRYHAAVTNGLLAADAVVAPTDAMRRALREEYGVTRSVECIPNGVDTAQSRPAVSRPKQPLVFAAGRVWDEAKNLAALCAIGDRLGWPIYIAGDAKGPNGTQAPLRGVTHLGHLSRTGISAWYERASIYALPARYEPFGLSVLEAALSGCALVLGDVPSLRETWNDAACFVPPDDHEALLSALEQLIAYPTTRDAYGARAAARASAFSIDRTADHYLRLYGTVAL